MHYTTFYDHTGMPIAWIGDNTDYISIFLFNGRPVAWSDGEAIYSYSGRYLGWIEDGWIFDKAGKRVFYTSEASGGPAKPARKARPARGARGARPARGARQARPARPARSSSWSLLSSAAYFDQ